MDGVADAAGRPRRRLDLGGMTFEEAERVQRGPGVFGDDYEGDEGIMPGGRTPNYLVHARETEKLVGFERYPPTKKVLAQVQAMDAVLRWTAEEVKPERKPGDTLRSTGSVPRCSSGEALNSQKKTVEDAEHKFQERLTELSTDVVHKDGRFWVCRTPGAPAVLFEAHELNMLAMELVAKGTLNRSQRHDAGMNVDCLMRRVVQGDSGATCHSITIGPGGAGKTHTANAVIRPLVVKLFGPACERGLCQANSACRVLGQYATTLHKGLNVRKGQKLGAKAMGDRARVGKLRDFWQHTLAVTLDEFGMTGADLFHTALQSMGMGRDGVDGFKERDYLTQLFGGIPSVKLTGDFMQLPPVIVQGLIAFWKDEPARKWEVEQAWKAYKSVENCIVLRECRRFEEPFIEELLNSIRAKRRVRDEVWTEFEQCFAGAEEHLEDGEDKRMQQPEFLDAMFTSVHWAMVAREQQRRAKRDAARAGAMLYYVQAVDNHRHERDRELYMRMLQVANMTKTARMMGMLPLYVGMQVRVTRRLSPALQIVQEATGTVVGIEFDVEERTPWVDDEQHAAWQRGWVNLEYLPTCVYVKMDGAEDVAFSEDLDPGVYAVTPEEDVTDQINILGVTMTFKRKQIPLAPRDVRTVQGMQGVTTPYLVANLAGGENLTTEEAREVYWAHVYVMLSRVKWMQHLIVINAPANLREILEAGPPRHVLREMARLYALERKTIPRALSALKRLGWESDEEYYGAEATKALQKRAEDDWEEAKRLADAVAASDGDEGSTTPGWQAPPADDGPHARITVWDYWPSGITVQYAEELREQGLLGRESDITARQRSIECGYITAQAAVQMLKQGSPLSRAEAREAARTALRRVQVSNFFLHHVAQSNEDRDARPMNDTVRYLDEFEVIELVASGMQSTSQDFMNEEPERFLCGPIDQIRVAVNALVEKGEPTTRVITALTTQRQDGGGYIRDSHFFTAFLEVFGPPPRGTKRGQGPAQKQAKKAKTVSQKRASTSEPAKEGPLHKFFRPT